MPDYLGEDQRKTKGEDKDDKPIRGIKYSIGITISRSLLWENADISCLANQNSALDKLLIVIGYDSVNF